MAFDYAQWAKYSVNVGKPSARRVPRRAYTVQVRRHIKPPSEPTGKRPKSKCFLYIIYSVALFFGHGICAAAIWAFIYKTSYLKIASYDTTVILNGPNLLGLCIGIVTIPCFLLATIVYYYKKENTFILNIIRSLISLTSILIVFIIISLVVGLKLKSHFSFKSNQNPPILLPNFYSDLLNSTMLDSIVKCCENYKSVCKAWDVVQQRLKCCGANHFDDWSQLSTKIPKSCCDQFDCSSDEFYDDGCLQFIAHDYMWEANMITIFHIIMLVNECSGLGLCAIAIWAFIYKTSYIKIANYDNNIITFSPDVFGFLAGIVSIPCFYLANVAYQYKQKPNALVKILSCLMILMGLSLFMALISLTIGMMNKSHFCFESEEPPLLLPNLFSNSLNNTMLESMLKFGEHLDISNAWNLVQRRLKCCGTNHFKEWRLIIEDIPLSCYAEYSPFASRKIFRNGCVDLIAYDYIWVSTVIVFMSWFLFANEVLALFAANYIYFKKLKPSEQHEETYVED